MTQTTTPQHQGPADVPFGAVPALGEDGASAILFGRYRALPHVRQLFADDQPIEIGGRAFDLLITLATARGAVVTKREVLDRVWPNLYVEEANLRVQLATLRKALGDDRDLIATVPGRGYSLTTEVTIASGASAAPGPAVSTATQSAAAAVRNTNLPERPDALIGRAADLAALDARLGKGRLVTVTGSGGIGKTRLAIELGLRQLDRFPDGVWLADLSPLTDPALAVSAVATALGVPLRSAGAATEALAAAIAARRLLLILDNCEHLVGTVAALVEALLAAVPGLSVLATSQETLRVPAEQVFRLNPLAVPSEEATEIAGYGAVDLFVERAQAADRRFALGADNAGAVAAICRGLDGLPLALEMAAARLPLLGLDGLRAGLDERLGMLGAGARGAEARHRTLRAMMAWSHGLLDPEEQQLFRRLAVFAGSFSLDAAVAVAGAGTGRWDLLDALGRLIDKSLVAVESGEPPRYRLLETLRLYALERLEASGERAVVAERHALFFRDLFDRADDVWEATLDAEWLRLHRPEIDHVRGALDWALADPSRTPVAVSLAGAAVHLLDRLVLYTEGRSYADRAVDLIGPDTPPAAAARLLKRAAALWFNTDRARALALAEQSVALYRTAGDRAGLATGLVAAGSLQMFLGRPGDAKAAFDEASAILSGTDRWKTLFNLSCSLGMAALFAHDGAEARQRFADALASAQALRDPDRESHVLMNLAEIDFGLGDVDSAVERGRQAVAAFRPTLRHTDLGVALVNLASYLLAQGTLPEARTVAEEALSRVRAQGGFIVRICLSRWALLGALEGRYREAARLVGFIDRGHAEAGETREPTEQKAYDHLRQLLAAALPADDIAAGEAEGAAWSEAEAVAFTLDRLVGPGRLSPG
jgi:predicted ATPase/DNA-binding winged helix-turn-helix (wHTH) protein